MSQVKTLYVIGHGGFLEFLWGFSIIMMMMAVAIVASARKPFRFFQSSPTCRG